jgi:GT2 family glycosyltransferase
MTQELVAGLRAQGPSPVVVVDNAGDYVAVAGETVLRPAANLGWLRGTNVGTRWALDHGAQAIVWMNNDVQLSGRFLQGIVDAANTAPDVGAVAPLYDGVNEVQRRGYAGPAGDFRGRPVEHEVSSADGTCYLARRAALLDVGLMDEETFGRHGWGGSDDFSLRLRRAGWRVLVTERSYLNHEGEVTARAVNEEYRSAAVAEFWLGMRRKYGRKWTRQFPDMGWVRSERLPHLRDRVRLRRSA